LMVADVAGGLAGSLEYNTDLFNATTIARMAGHFQTLLAGIVANPEQPVAKLPLLTEEERHKLLVEWTNTWSEKGRGRLSHEVFEEVAAKHPDGVALRFEEHSMTYAELNKRSNQLARHLRGLGVKTDTLVGICVERSFEMIVAMLGVFKAGGAYVPLDPTYPSNRLAFMLEDAQPLVLLTKQHLLENVPEHGAQVVCLDSDWETIAQHSGENFDSGVQIQDLAYVIYTSGSTGKPKGVLVTHTGVYNAIEGHLPDMQVGCDARVLQFASFSFDASVSEILSALLTGATLYLARRETLMTGQGLVKLLQEEQITHGTIPPSVLMLIADNEFPHLRTIISAGEAISREMILLWKNKGHRIVNGYGPTECTILITWELMEGERLPYLGKPVQNTYGYLVDKHMQPVPIGVPGELLIGGLGVARGYLNRPDLTAEKFIPDPFSGVEGARVYRTGDLIRYWEDGTMEYLGRIDHQVKIRGFRIEIGEIEELLAQHEDVRQVVLTVREDAPGQKRLVAYIAPHNGKTIAGSDLRLYLKQKLPEYMVPS
ncbi:MAG: non-ribosomal peptide synthetase, partial [Tumebacillaceae bacterium]